MTSKCYKIEKYKKTEAKLHAHVTTNWHRYTTYQ